ncbi:hypothetical protein GUITHDRAFT_121489 [Guillardia theta CCMP2712]|uniref:Laminin IV type A domain-containing protein n=1 Tax=Guillardia theta (strain CCMP2712) TaxID=905079 RepID=L1I806_GUITC|nr:hypothetical protein GUITHDRAFT_121489 [Guillardia theta CCMP2712]EKX32348.1 hypothetical protein GUITHDRAFT_121489 [Guillardia theta CCMP2712]|eukprot:XP_005819328.1 hypothetical protein GUITHDRAFT_121489 [Guillardia theta CCMP2712]
MAAQAEHVDQGRKLKLIQDKYQQTRMQQINSFCLIVFLHLIFLSSGVEAVDRILASASFPADARWMTSYLNDIPAPYQVQVDNTGASATDRSNDNQPWYFTSGAVFSGDMSDAYNGLLSFRLMHVQIADSNAVMIKSHPIVILKATCGYSLTWTPKSFPSTDMVTVNLNEYSGWKDSRTGKAPDNLDFLGVLSHLESIKILGSYFTSAETTKLMDVKLIAGSRSQYPCCNARSEVDACTTKPSQEFNPPNLVFYCEGSQRKSVKISKIYPRYSRRTGGTWITVTGENFGLAGTKPIVRIDGRQCEATKFVPSRALVQLPSTIDASTILAPLNNKRGNALLNAWMTATDSMKNMYPEHCWNGMKDDGTDKGYNYGTEAAPKYINQGETGIDTGGPCFPSHCSSCPDSSKSWCDSNYQIIAESSGTCKGRGDPVTACNQNFPYQRFPSLCPDNLDTPLVSNVVSTLRSQTRYSTSSLTQTDKYFDLLDIRSTNITAQLAAIDTSMTVFSIIDLVCQHQNTPLTRNCLADGTATELVQNFVKIFDASDFTKYEVVLVEQITGDNTIKVSRGKGGTTAITFTAGSKVYQCGKNEYCATSQDLANNRYIRVDDEIMKVTSAGGIAMVSIPSTTCGSGYNGSTALIVECVAPCTSRTPLTGSVQVNPSDNSIASVTVTDPGSGYSSKFLPTITVANGDGCTLTPLWTSAIVSRAQALTTAQAHANVPTISRMDCIDSDETGDNCGGRCKPCPSGVRGPQQQDTVLCLTPELKHGLNPSDLAVTVEAAPGPTNSPYQVRMNEMKTGWVDKSSYSVSCVSEQNRGFEYGAHDFVWSSSLKSDYAVVVTGTTVDGNTGDTYVVGAMVKQVTIEGKHIMSAEQMGSLTVTTSLSTCTPTITGIHDVVGLQYGCALNGFIARFSKSGKAMWLNKVEATGSSTTPMSVLTDAAFDPARSELYVVGHYSDGQTDGQYATTLNLYDVNPSTRTSAATTTNTMAMETLTSTNGIYQEGIIVKYGREGNVLWYKKIDASVLSSGAGMIVSDLKIETYKASTSNIINTQLHGIGKPPTAPTSTSRVDINYDSGIAQQAVQGGTGTVSTITLASTASSTNKWYNGLTIRITKGPGYGQKRTIYEYDGTSKVAKVQPDWDPQQLPTSASQYVIEGGRPTSWVSGMHWSNGGVYVSGKIQTFCGQNCFTNADKNATYVRMGEMRDVYRDSTSKTTPKHIDVILSQDDHQNFVSQFDMDGRVFWTRLVGSNGLYGQVVNGALASFTFHSSQTLEDNMFEGALVTVVAGTNMGETRMISSFSASTNNVTVSTDFSDPCDSTTKFIISNKGTTGTVTSVTAPNTAILSGDFLSFDDAYKGFNIIFSKADGTTRSLVRIDSYTASTQTFTFKAYGTSFTAAANDQFHILDAATIAAMSVADDKVFLTGLATQSYLRVQNCSFDSATVLEGPPANTQPTQVFECANVGTSLMGPTTYDPSSVALVAQGSNKSDASVGMLKAFTGWGMYTLAYNGSGAATWLQQASGGTIRPRAIVAVEPSIGGRALESQWGGTPDSRSLPSRNQPDDASHARDVGSENFPTAVIDGRYVYVASEVYDWMNATDFGRTRFPLECSRGKTLGEKSVSTDRLLDAQCAGQVVAKGSSSSWPGSHTASPDIVLVQYSMQDGTVNLIRRTGQMDGKETVTSMAADPLTGSVYLTGQYYVKSTSDVQGGETRTGGEDIFDLVAAKRGESVGCPLQRVDGTLSLGESGTPYCKFYAQAKSTATGTGYLVKFSFNGDENNRGNLNRRLVPSITGHLTASSSLLSCQDKNLVTADTNGQTHVLTGSADCKTHVSGCSCLYLVIQSRLTDGAAVYQDSGTGPTSQLSGYKIRITAGRSKGYEGIISAYSVSSKVYNVIPSLPSTGVDETSLFQLFPWSEFTSRLHLPSCSAPVNAGCGAYNIDWAKTIGRSLSTGGNTQTTAQTSPVSLSLVHSDLLVAGTFSGFVGSTTTGQVSLGFEGIDEVVGFANQNSQIGSFLTRLED